MPYKDDEIPAAVKGQPAGLISIYRAAFNAAAEAGNDEESCARIAWSAVKRKYKKGEGDKWVLKESVERTGQARIQDSYRLPCKLLEAKEGQKYPRMDIGFAPADTFSRSRPPRMYPAPVLREAIAGMQSSIADGVYGANAHTESGRYDDLVWIVEKAYFDETEQTGHCIVELLTDTPAGKVIQHLAEKGLPIKSSLSGWGDEKLDEKITDKNGRKGGMVVQSGLEIDRVDPLWNPAFKTNSSKLLESLLQEETGMDNETITKQMAEINGKLKPIEDQIASVTEQLGKLPKDAPPNFKDSDEFKKLSEQVTSLTNDKKVLQDQRDATEEVRKVLADAEKMKGLEGFRPKVEKRLLEAKSIAEIEPMLKELREILGDIPNPIVQEKAKTGVEVIRDESATKFLLTDNVEQAWKQLTESFRDNGNNGLAKVDSEADKLQDAKKLGNERWLAKRLMENFIFWNCRDHEYKDGSRRYNIQSIFDNVPTNPLYGCTKERAKQLREAVGDDHMATSDVATANIHLLPHYQLFMKEAIANLNALVGIQPINKSSAKIYFWKEYYLASGTDSEISANFTRTQSAKAEEAAAQQLKLMIIGDTVSLQTALKAQTPINVEAIQNAQFDLGIDLLAEGINLGRRELMREISSQIVYYIVNTAGSTNGDGLVQVANSPTDYSITVPPGEGYTQAEWATVGLRKVINQASSLMNKNPYNVRGNTLLGDSDFDYLFDTGMLRANDVNNPTGIGIDRIGTWNQRYTYMSTDDAGVDNKLVSVYRGASPIDAAVLFCPLVLFYIDDLHTKVGTLQKTRCFMSRFAIVKVLGSFISIINYIA